jgi:uncharacterized protein
MGLQDLAETRRIVLDGLSNHKARVFLFGSRARGEARSASDIDVGVLPAAPLPFGLLGEIRERLEESTIPFEVDLVDLSEAGESFRRRVEREGIAWNA